MNAPFFTNPSQLNQCLTRSEFTMQKVDFVASASLSLKLLHYSGNWVTPESSTRYKIYAFFMQMVVCYTFLVNLVLVLPSEQDLESFMMSFPVIMAMAGYAVKLINLYLRRHKVHEFFILLNSPESQVHTPEELEIVIHHNRLGKKLVYIWFGIFFCAGLAAVLPMLSIQPKIPYPIYYPDWRKEQDLVPISCVYEFFCVLIASVINGIMDSFMSYFLTILSGMVAAFSWKLQTLNNLNEADITKEFVKCINRYQHLLRISQEMQNVFSTVTFAQIFISSLTVCGLLFQLSLLSPLTNPNTFFKLVCFAAAIFLQIFIPCYTATEVRIKSENLKLSIYTSNWTEYPRHIKKMMIIFMQRLQHPILITVGGILCLGMENFMGVLRFSYSLYSLLRRVHSK